MESVIRAAAVYLILLLVMRFAGRRTLAEATPFDFVLLLIIAETTQQALLGDDFSITNAVVLFVSLAIIDVIFSYVKQWSPRAAKFLDGVPTVLIRNGKMDERAMERARVSPEDVMGAARRRQGIARLEDVEHAVLENDSGISIIPKDR